MHRLGWLQICLSVRCPGYRHNWHSSDPVEETVLCPCCYPSPCRSSSAAFDLQVACTGLNPNPSPYRPCPYLPYFDCPSSFRSCLACLFLWNRSFLLQRSHSCLARACLSLSSPPCRTYTCPPCFPFSYRPSCPCPCPPSCALDAGPSGEPSLSYPSWEQVCRAHSRYDLQVAQRWCKQHSLWAARSRHRSRQHQCGTHPLLRALHRFRQPAPLSFVGQAREHRRKSLKSR